jgi:putative transposase
MNPFVSSGIGSVRVCQRDPVTPYRGLQSSRWKWHLGEIFVKINGEMHYLWQAVDHEGEVLESFVTKKRDKKAALKFIRKVLRKYGQPEVIVTDKLRSYGAALKKIGADARQENGR